MPTFCAGVEQGGSLVSGSGLPLLEICLIVSALVAVCLGYRQFLCLLVLLNYLQFCILCELHHCFVVADDGEVVSALMAEESIALVGILDHQHFKAEGAKFHRLGLVIIIIRV